MKYNIKSIHTSKKLCIGVSVIIVIALCFFFFRDYLNFAYIQQQHEYFSGFYQREPQFSVALFILVFVLLTSLSLPVTGILTVLSGAIFGVYSGTLITTFASTSGAVLAFLFSRYLLQDWVRVHFTDQFKRINRGIEDEGAYYLFSARLLTVFPFFLINLSCGITGLSLRSFIAATLPAQFIISVVFNYAGLQLSMIDSIQSVLSPNLVLSLLFIGLVPLICHRLLAKN